MSATCAIEVLQTESFFRFSGAWHSVRRQEWAVVVESATLVLAASSAFIASNAVLSKNVPSDLVVADDSRDFVVVLFRSPAERETSDRLEIA